LASYRHVSPPAPRLHHPSGTNRRPADLLKHNAVWAPQHSGSEAYSKPGAEAVADAREAAADLFSDFVVEFIDRALMVHYGAHRATA